jgi:hypothetical protein
VTKVRKKVAYWCNSNVFSLLILYGFVTR